MVVVAVVAVRSGSMGNGKEFGSDTSGAAGAGAGAVAVVAVGVVAVINSTSGSGSGVKFGGSWGCHWSRAVSIAWAVDSNSVRRTAVLEGFRFVRPAFPSSVLRARRPARRCMMGHSVVAIPSSVSTLHKGEIDGAPKGGTGWRQPGVGVAESGGVPLDRAVITS